MSKTNDKGISRPILEILVRKLSDIGFRNFYISVGISREQIMDYFGDGSSMGINKLSYENNLGTTSSLSHENINSQP